MRPALWLLVGVPAVFAGGLVIREDERHFSRMCFFFFFFRARDAAVVYVGFITIRGFLFNPKGVTLTRVL